MNDSAPGDSFASVLNRVMGEHGLSQGDVGRICDVSQAAVGRWLRGHTPTDRMREKVTAALQKPIPETTKRARAGARQAPPYGLVTVTMQGPTIELTMKITLETARKLLQMLVSEAHG
jgi:transcriptional regulator with XRE-family HTH domain